MEFRYILNKEEIYRALKETGYIKTTGKRAVWGNRWFDCRVYYIFVFYCINGDERNLFFAVISAVFALSSGLFRNFCCAGKQNQKQKTEAFFRLP